MLSTHSKAFLYRIYFLCGVCEDELWIFLCSVPSVPHIDHRQLLQYSDAHKNHNVNGTGESNE